MNNDFKVKELEDKIKFLKTTPSCYERNVLIAELYAQIDSKQKVFAKFNYVKHHKYMDIDIYKILWKDLYGHFKRLVDTMNENNVCDLDMLDIKRTQKYMVKVWLESHWLIKEVKWDIRSKIFLNPAFALNNRILVSADLEELFREENMHLYKLDLKKFIK